MINKLGAAATVAVLLLAGACGSNSDSSSSSAKSSGSAKSSSSASASASGSRPTQAELSTAFQKGFKASGQSIKLPKAQADCLSKVLVASDLSDAALEAFATGNTAYKPSTKDSAAATALQSKIQACAK